MHAAELLVPEPGPFEVETAIEMLKNNKSPEIDKILAVLIQEEGNVFRSEFQRLVEEFVRQRKFPYL
jgi:hypothetical protein